jgi:hypothetical protein
VINGLLTIICNLGLQLAQAAPKVNAEFIAIPFMAQALKKTHSDSATALPASLSPPETARYTSDLLESLRKIAVRQGHGMLAHLLELAQYEAHSLAAKTRTPDSPDAGRSAQPAPVRAEP